MSTPDERAQLSRRRLLRLGAAGGLSVAASSVGLVGFASPAYAMQSNWRWCHRCEGLWFAGNNTNGACSADGGGAGYPGHSREGSGNYTLKFNFDGGPGQDGWRHCFGCQTLFFYTGEPRGPVACPRNPDAGHDPNTGIYRVEYFPHVPSGGQREWRWCMSCEGMWFNGNPGRGQCLSRVTDDGMHVSIDSAEYIIRHVAAPAAGAGG